MTDQFLGMLPPWDPIVADANQHQPLRYRFNMIMGYRPGFDAQLSWLGPIKPLAYVDLLAVYADANRTPNITANPSFVLKDANHNPLFINWGCNNGTCPQYCGDPTNPAFRAFQMNQIQVNYTAGYGVALDDVNTMPCSSDGNGTIILPAGVTADTWARAVVQMVEEIRRGFYGITLHNSVWFSTAPPDLIDRQIAACDYVNCERGYGDPNLTPTTTEAFMNFVDHVHTLGRRVVINENTKANLSYLLACYRLTLAPGDLFCVADLYPPGDPSLDVATGAPLAARVSKGNHVWTRAFANGTVTADLVAKTGTWGSS